jgi:hypothetical protein
MLTSSRRLRACSSCWTKQTPTGLLVYSLDCFRDIFCDHFQALLVITQELLVAAYQGP